VTVYSDSSYLANCIGRGWHERWRENGWLNRRKETVANRNLWERLLEAARRHREVRWRKVKGHQRTGGAHKAGNDRADELAVAASSRETARKNIGIARAWSARFKVKRVRAVFRLQEQQQDHRRRRRPPSRRGQGPPSKI
jgi:hypothetical protein